MLSLHLLDNACRFNKTEHPHISDSIRHYLSLVFRDGRDPLIIYQTRSRNSLLMFKSLVHENPAIPDENF
ncbi:hypothetical protein CEXT_508341 [Caerostris extrusa]|uniref:Uncharacterized protein n=1 Tax=Caerostris extrusa TaxID=172846 RepID=A0AAV4TXA5_CAEEX|nr:hypothetical protein CEXT_508341 [Caerostris extrusa]